MRIKLGIRAAVVASVSALVLSACGGGSLGGDETTDSGSADTLKIGYVSPTTGPLAAFGEADAYVIDTMKAHFADNPIVAGDKTYNVEIIVKDAQSDSKRAGEVTADLINKDGVDLVLASSTPDIVNPVADQCEANATPCITTVAPWQPYFYGRGKADGESFNWTYHFFWGLEDVAATYSDIWSKVKTNGKIGGLFPNDPDGNAWGGAFPDLTKSKINNPGFYTNLTQDFTAQISAYKKDNDEVLVGIPIPPDFTTFWKQAAQQGYKPKVATIGKAMLFPSSVEALGDLGNNISSEVWWTPNHPFSSSLTQQSAADLAAAYEESTGKQWTQPLGFAHALFEVAAAALTAAGSKDKQAVVDALATLKVSTIVGNLDWTSGPVPNVAKTPLAGGQWRKVDGGKFPYDLVIVSNKVASEIPVASEPQPIK